MVVKLIEVRMPTLPPIRFFTVALMSLVDIVSFSHCGMTSTYIIGNPAHSQQSESCWRKRRRRLKPRIE